ncbi:MAG TPA: TRAM domain-containing protein [Thermoanaerobaculia bacterium]|nr:TRAM domain-containing protein [Thermoanaerobaculia bacterium]
MYQIGDQFTIEPTELVAGGAALARIDGFPVFATNVYPGDVAVVRLIEVKKGFARADLVRIVTPSPLRRAMPCPIAEECGGCDWTALRLDAQLLAKRRILTESLRRIGKFDPATLPEIRIHPSPLNYRLRSRLHRDGDAVGFYAMRSNRVVPLAKECEVVGVNTALSVARDPLPEEIGEEIEIWEVGQGTTDNEFTITVENFTYRLGHDAFFQVNRHLLGTMLRLVSGIATRTRTKSVAVDLYAGVGFFTLPLAKMFERVVAIEGSPASARYARMNVPRNVKVVEKAVERATIPEADFIFLDPPRAGARREVIDAVAARAKERIAYLSCDPVTFARDASRLTASGWRLSTLDLLDLFPNTHHVETLSSLERAG